MLADIHGYATYLAELRREPEQMRTRAAARLVLSTESGYAAGRALSEFYLGLADTLGSDLEGGIERMRHHLSELRAAGFEVAAAYHLALTATALGKAGQFDEALRTIEESFSIIERTGQRHHEAEVHRLKGELLLAQRSIECRRCGEVFPRRDRNCAQAAREVMGAARDHESRTPANNAAPA